MCEKFLSSVENVGIKTSIIIITSCWSLLFGHVYYDRIPVVSDIIKINKVFKGCVSL